MKLLESKLQVTGAEEAHTQFAEGIQRIVAAIDSASAAQDSGEQQKIVQILSEVQVGSLQDLRQSTRRFKHEVDQIYKQLTTLQEERKSRPTVPKPAGHRPGGGPGPKKDRLGTAASKIAGDPMKAVSGVINMLSGALPLGVGGILGLMLYGVAKEQDLRAQSNRFSQIWEESMRGTGDVAEGISRSAASRMAETAKALELRFAATRGEIEAVARTFSTAGVSAGEALANLDNAIGPEQKNLYMLSLSLERHFELAGGTVARQASDFIVKYGMDADDAADAVVRLSVAGAQSGIGLTNFSNTILQSAAAVRFLGVDARSVIDLTTKLQKSYESIGIDRHMAGQMATTGVQQVMAGLSSMPIGEQILVAERAGFGKGLEARFAMAEKLVREGGADPQALGQYIRAAYSIAMEASHGDPNVARLKLEQRFGFEGARSIIKGNELLSQLGSLEKVSKAQLSEIAGGLKTEEQKTSDFKRAMEEILRGMADIGFAMFNVTAALLAEQILSLRLVVSMLEGDTASTTAIFKAMQETAGVFPKALAQAKVGLGHLGEAAGELDFESLDLLSEAMSGVLPSRRSAVSSVVGAGTAIAGAARDLTDPHQVGAALGNLPAGPGVSVGDAARAAEEHIRGPQSALAPAPPSNPQQIVGQSPTENVRVGVQTATVTGRVNLQGIHSRGVRLERERTGSTRR